MKKTAKLLCALLTLSGAWQPVHAGSGTPMPADEPTRQSIYAALNREAVLGPERVLVRLVHVCNLQLDKTSYPVVWLRELVHSSTLPRGVNRIVVLGPDLRVSTLLENLSGDTEPLFCLGNRLYLYGREGIGNAAPYGNVLELSNRGRTLAVVGLVEPQDYPLPLNRERRLSPQ
ncbi:MAG: hypothetical protein U1A78_23025 [Polyangia bacterium]